MKSLDEYFSLRTITIIQFALALCITLLFQFVIPISWQPLYAFEHGSSVQHGDPDVNVVFFSITQWYLSFSIAWLIYRKNPIVNNFLVFAVVQCGPVIVYEFLFIYLFYDYIHGIPVIVGILILKNEFGTVKPRKYAPVIIPIGFIWVLLVSVLRLAYFMDVTLTELIINDLLNVATAIAYSLILIKMKEKNPKYKTQNLSV